MNVQDSIQRKRSEQSTTCRLPGQFAGAILLSNTLFHTAQKSFKHQTPCQVLLLGRVCRLDRDHKVGLTAFRQQTMTIIHARENKARTSIAPE